MVYSYESKFIHTPYILDVTMVFSLNDWRFIEANKFNEHTNTVVYDLDYGEYALFNVKCNGDQCELNVSTVGVYDDKKGELQLIKTEEYHTNFSRFSITDIALTKWAPIILRHVMKYLRPFDIPCHYYIPSDVEQIIDQVSRFFNEYFSEDD